MSAWEEMVEITLAKDFALCKCQRSRQDVRGGDCKGAPGLRHPDSLGDLLGAVAMNAPVIDHTNDAIFYVNTDINDTSRWAWDDEDTTAEDVIRLQRIAIATKYTGLKGEVMREAIAQGVIPASHLMANHVTHEWPRFRILKSYRPVDELTPEELAEMTRRIKGE